MSDNARLADLAGFAAEQALDILQAEILAIVEGITLTACGANPAVGPDALEVVWEVDYGGGHHYAVSMQLLAEFLDDEEALVLSMAAWLLHSIQGNTEPLPAQA